MAETLTDHMGDRLDDTGLAAPADRISAGYAVGAVLSVLLTLALGYLLLRPPMGDMAQLALQLGATALLSVVAGYGACRMGWIDRSPRLSYTLLGGYVLATALIIFNVWVSARLMFLNRHDLLLGTALLVFAGGIAVALGYLFSDVITARLVALNRFAADVARGRLDARIDVSGRDEIAELGSSLNQMAAQLEAAQARQRQLEQMRRELIAWAGHDLRTPLASVRAIVEALADGVVEDEATTARYLATAKRDIRSLSGLIDNLFALAQIDAGGLELDLEPNALSDLLSDTLESFTPLARQQEITLHGRAAPDVDPVTMDARLIGRVLNNLISNALRHTPAGGEIRVTAERGDATVEVAVRDSGEGIPADALPHVFDRFYRGERSRSRATGGSGLGLAIAKGIVEAHGGDMTVESTPSEGTRIAFTLPAEG